MLTGFTKILAVQSCLDTCSHDTLIYTVSELQETQQNVKSYSCRTQLTLFLLSSMRHPLPCEGCDRIGSGGLEPIKPDKGVKK